jgi:dTDP-4-amino-4,6-dideoxygalactose transaminase
VKLQRLSAANDARRAIAALYNERLSSLKQIIIPKERIDGLSVYHVYAVRVQNRDHVLKRLSDRGIGCGVHYPIPVHLQPAYAFLGHKVGDFPISEMCGREFLSLPMFPELTSIQVDKVIQELRGATE